MVLVVALVVDNHSNLVVDMVVHKVVVALELVEAEALELVVEPVVVVALLVALEPALVLVVVLVVVVHQF